MWAEVGIIVDLRLYPFRTKREAGRWGVCKVAQRNSSFGKTSAFCRLAQFLFVFLFEFFWGGEEGKYISQSLIEWFLHRISCADKIIEVHILELRRLLLLLF